MGTENKNNFKCPITGEEFYVNEYTIGYGAGGKIFMDKYTKKVLVNPLNNEPLVDIEKISEYNVNIGKFSGLSRDEKKKVLKRRSANHNASQKDRWHSINRNEKQ